MPITILTNYQYCPLPFNTCHTMLSLTHFLDSCFGLKGAFTTATKALQINITNGFNNNNGFIAHYFFNREIHHASAETPG